MTLSQKILAQKAQKSKVESGELIMAKLDMVLGNDITSPVAIKEFQKANKTKVFDKNKISIVLDHFVPNKDIKSAQQCKICRDFAKEYEITNFFDVGKMGIEHTLIPDSGLAAPSDLIIGADSHTCTYGAVSAFSTGVGSTDMAYGMAHGELWFKVPSAIKIELLNAPANNVSGKDVILNLIGQIGVSGALYQSLEFCGEGAAALSIDDRFTICNMAIEAGAKNGIFAYDQKTAEYVKGRVKKPFEPLYADKDAKYEKTIIIDLAKLVPTVACPHLPSNTKPADSLHNVKIDQVVIGSCTNGRLADLKQAADVLRGKKIKDGVRVIVIPATNDIYLAALKAGYIEDFINAGAIVSTPTCGPCLGGYMGILAQGEVCIATTNRNFIGRMGHNDSSVYLSSPFVAACSAVLGHIGIL